MKNKICSIAILICTLIFTNCKRNKSINQKPGPEFAKHVTGYTNTMMSIGGSFKIELAEPIGNLGNTALPDSNLLDNIFSISPVVKGRAIWTSNRTLEFIPAEPLDAEEVYTVTFKLNKIIPVGGNLKKMVFNVATFQQNIKVSNYSLVSMDGYNMQYISLIGTAELTDITDTNKLFTTVSAKIENKNYKVHWQKESDTKYSFKVDSISRNNTTRELHLQWNGKAIKANDKGEAFLKVRALNDFEIEQCNVINTDEAPYVEIVCSDLVNKTQNLNGLITISNHTDLTYSIRKNIINVYLKNIQFGNCTVSINKNVQNKLAYNLKENYTQAITIDAPKPRVQILQGGNILPNSQGLFLPFKTIGLHTVDVRIVKIFENNVHQFLQINDLNGAEGLKRVGKIMVQKKIRLDADKKINLEQWETHVLDLNKWIQPEVSCIYRVSIKFNKKYTNVKCMDTNEAASNTDEALVSNYNSDENADDTDEEMTADSWHGYSFDEGYNGYEDYNNTYEPCEESYYDGMAVSKNILASDIGLIYKQDANKNGFVYASNMLTSAPMPNVQIEIYNYTKQKITSGTTDANGYLQLAIPEQAFLLIAKNNMQRGYLKIKSGLNNSLTKFDVGGTNFNKNIKGYIYAERGVWRPGDSIYLNFMLHDPQKTLPANHPIQFSMQDANGKTVQQFTLNNNAGGLIDCRTATNLNAPTGFYNATVKVGNAVFTKSILIETIKPNRLKIKNIIADTLLTVNNSNTFNTLQAQWLHGAIAKNCKANISAKFKATNIQFKNYSNYAFNDALQTATQNEITVFDGALNDSGNVRYNCNFGQLPNMPSAVEITYNTKVFEPSGEFSIDQNKQTYLPYASYIGLQNNTDMYMAGKNYIFNTAFITPNGLPINNAKANLKIYKLNNNWWYQQGDDDFTDFITRTSTELIFDTTLTSNNGKAAFNFDTKMRDGGLYIFALKDLSSGHVSRQKIFFNTEYFTNGANINTEHASMLALQTNLQKYTVGQKIILTIPSSANGHALISIENSNTVLQSFWIPTQAGKTIYSLAVTEAMQPNIYIHVSLIQPYYNTSNNMPMRMYGVLPLTIDNPATHLNPNIQCAESIRPQTNVPVVISETAGKEMYYSVVAVDDGLLDITRFKTPDVWQFFNDKEALGVKTWDIYDQVIGAYAGKLDRMLQIGGDGSFDDAMDNKAQRFKPAIQCLGNFYLPANTSKTHIFNLPNYMGSVRIMVVAKNNIAFGNAQKTVFVKKPIMLLSTMPRMFTAGEQIDLPIQIFSTDAKIKDVQLKVSTNNLVQINSAVQTIHFNSISDELVNLKIKVGTTTGIATIHIIAKSGLESAYEDVEISVRPPNAQEKLTQQYTIPANGNITHNLQLMGLPNSQNLTIETSTFPLTNVQNRLQYLITYPHGCVEQTTSAAFPQLYIATLCGTDSMELKIIKQHVQAAINKLQLFETNNGGFSYWPGEADASEFGSNYAAHFLLEAQQKGFTVSAPRMARWQQYQKNMVRNWQPTLAQSYLPHAQESNIILQAYRLYTLALAGSSELGAMNQLRETKNLDAVAACYLAMAYNINGQHEIANNLTQNLIVPNNYKELSYGYGSTLRDKAIMLQCYTALNNSKKNKLAQELTDAINSNNLYNTQECAYTLMALSSYYGNTQNAGTLNYSIANNGNKNMFKINKQLHSSNFKNTELQNNSNCVISNNSTQNLYANITQTYYAGHTDTISKAAGLKMQVLYKNRNGKIMDVKNIKQSEDFVAEITITNTSNTKYLQEMALQFTTPTGWEILNSASNNTNNNARNINYCDNAIYFFYNLQPNGSSTFTVNLNATYAGTFYKPNVYTDAMYDHTIFAKVGGGWVNVVK